MGKISNALQKVMKEREAQKKQEEQLRKEAMLKPEAKPKPEVKPSAKSKETFEKKERLFGQPLTLREKFASGKTSLEERLKQRERIYVVKSSDDSGIDPKVVAYHDYYSPVSEQYRALRTNIKSHLKKTISSAKLKITNPVGRPNILTITSSVQGEGKTVTSANLAVILAHDFESKVLLIDCDLRRGSVHKMFGVKNQPGLLDFFAGTAEWPDIFHKTAVKNLTVTPTGEAHIAPTELLGSKKMSMIIERLKRESFNYIILDTPPLLPFTDAGVLGAQTDGVILVVQSRRTQAHSLKKTKEFLEQAQAKLLGFVLTHADYYIPNFYDHYYYYYSHSHQARKAKASTVLELAA